MTSDSNPNVVTADSDGASSLNHKSPEKGVKQTQLLRHTSDADFDELLSNIDAGDMCENIEFLHTMQKDGDLNEAGEDGQDNNDDNDEDEEGNKKRSSVTDDEEKSKPQMCRQSSTWSFSLGSFDGSYSEDVSAAIEEFSTGTTSRDDIDISNLSSNFFRVVNLPKHTNINNNNSQHNTTIGSIHSKYQSSFNDIDSDPDEEELQQFNEGATNAKACDDATDTRGGESRISNTD